MFLENAVLHDDVVVGLEASGLSIELVDDPLAIVVQQLLEARVAVDRRTAPAVDDRRVACGDTSLWSDRSARVDLAAIKHRVQRLIHGEPAMGETRRPGVVRAERAGLAPGFR